MVVCEECGTEAMDGDKFCRQCGAELGEEEVYTCECGAEVLPNDNFCHKCGAAFTNPDADQEDEPEKKGEESEDN